MFRYKTIKEQLLEGHRKNEALNAQLIEQKIINDELTNAVIELAAIITGELTEEGGEDVG